MEWFKLGLYKIIIMEIFKSTRSWKKGVKSGEKMVRSVLPQQQCLGSSRFCYRNKSNDFSAVKAFTSENLQVLLQWAWHLCINSSENTVVNNRRNWSQEGRLMLRCVASLILYVILVQSLYRPLLWDILKISSPPKNRKKESDFKWLPLKCDI